MPAGFKQSKSMARFNSINGFSTVLTNFVVACNPSSNERQTFGLVALRWKSATRTGSTLG